MVQRHPLAVFFVLAYSISWLLWTPPALAGLGVLASEPGPVFHLLGGLGPMIAALVTARLHGGRNELRGLLQRMAAVGIGLRWQAVVWLGPLVVFLLAAGGAALVGDGGWDPATLGRSPEYPSMPAWGYLALVLVFFGFGEETGWRGFALGYLQEGRGALAATLLLTLAWIGWHLPLFAFATGLGELGALEVVGWVFSIVTGSILLTWITNGTRGSIYAAAVFHATMDVAFVSPAPSLVTNGVGVLITAWGVAVLVAAGPRYLSRKGKVLRGERFEVRIG